eukprot:TRINITY_DN18524_c0_g1_i1.p1 TRINITY_DN18524_c0_g1~~TRINITY_DN18524_c0_g1_i1.p1  ORF type:complete len:576 (+),score=111.45 TRINITY_DN18524_c0_g1_i1:58-1728(+)
MASEAAPDDYGPYEDDGTVDLALMATEHPMIRRSGAAILAQRDSLNALLPRVAAAAPAGGAAARQSEALAAAREEVSASLRALHAEIDRMDDMELDGVEASEREGVRMARKALIGLAQGIVGRLEKLQKRLAPPAEARPSAAAGAAAGAAGQRSRSRSRSAGRAAAPSRATARRGNNNLGATFRRPRHAHAHDDEGGSEPEDDRNAPHFAWEIGMKLGSSGRYAVQRSIGEGSFGRVLQCTDRTTGDTVAVKIVKNLKRYCEHAQAEAEILREIARRDPKRQSRCVQLLDRFLHVGFHYCLVFEMLGWTLRDLLKASDNTGLLVRDIRLIGLQLLQCLAFLHNVGFTHTDLKCTNVMLRDMQSDVVPLPRSTSGETTRTPSKCEISLIDFGSAVFKDESRRRSNVGARHYRAPEVLLDLPWDEKVDLWSTGCVLLNLYIGARPFPLLDRTEHLVAMERVLGSTLPSAMGKAALSAATGPPMGLNLDERGRLAWPGDAGVQAIERVERCAPLADQLAPQHLSLVRLLTELLRLDPKRRITAKEALLQPFFLSEIISE